MCVIAVTNSDKRGDRKTATTAAKKKKIIVEQSRAPSRGRHWDLSSVQCVWLRSHTLAVVKRGRGSSKELLTSILIFFKSCQKEFFHCKLWNSGAFTWTVTHVCKWRASHQHVVFIMLKGIRQTFPNLSFIYSSEAQVQGPFQQKTWMEVLSIFLMMCCPVNLHPELCFTNKRVEIFFCFCYPIHLLIPPKNNWPMNQWLQNNG